jgi:hypothetical protein
MINNMRMGCWRICFMVGKFFVLQISIYSFPGWKDVLIFAPDDELAAFLPVPCVVFLPLFQ